MELGYIALGFVLLVAVIMLYRRAATRSAFPVDMRVQLGEDGFTYSDLSTPIDWNIWYELEIEGGKRVVGSFQLTARKMWVYTGFKPIGVCSIGPGQLGPQVAPGKPWSPSPKVGGQKSTPHVKSDAQQRQPHQPHRPDASHDESYRGADTSEPSLFGGEWGGGASNQNAPDYPQTDSYGNSDAGSDYAGGGGESGGGGSSVSWDSDTSSGSAGSSGGNDSYPSAY